MLGLPDANGKRHRACRFCSGTGIEYEYMSEERWRDLMWRVLSGYIDQSHPILSVEPVGDIRFALAIAESLAAQPRDEEKDG